MILPAIPGRVRTRIRRLTTDLSVAVRRESAPVHSNPRPEP